MKRCTSISEIAPCEAVQRLFCALLATRLTRAIRLSRFSDRRAPRDSYARRFQDVPAVNARLTIGAGDTFRAGIAHGVLQGWSDERSVRFAIEAAAAVCVRGAAVCVRTHHPQRSSTGSSVESALTAFAVHACVLANGMLVARARAPSHDPSRSPRPCARRLRLEAEPSYCARDVRPKMMDGVPSSFSSVSTSSRSSSPQVKRYSKTTSPASS